MDLVTATLLALVAQASPVDAEKVADPATALPVIPSDGFTTRTRLAVMTLNAPGLPPEYAEGLTETIATTVHETGVFEVISPRQISSLLAFEKRKELLGGCVEEACYLQVAKTVQARHLVGGSIAKVGGKMVLNLVVIDAIEGTALKRVNRETTDAPQLMSEARSAAIVLLQPILSARQGYLKVAVNMPDAGIAVDDERRVEGVGQVIALSAGPHVLKVNRDGFYSTTADVFVRPGRVVVEEVKLIPARETIQSHESSAKLMRYTGYGTAILAVGAAVASGIFYAQATDDKAMVDRYTSALAADRALMDRNEVLSARDSFGTNQALYLSLLGGAVISGGISLYMFLAGEDPDRYEEFHALSGM